MNEKYISNKTLNPLDLSRQLIRCPSVTPKDEGAIDLIDQTLTKMGFSCYQIPFSEPETETVNNLYAEFGNNGKNFCFAGHSDVVPVGEGWSCDPFEANIINGNLFGRGAADMKRSIACFISAVSK